MSSYKSLYRKWRPQSFADVVGQDHITSVLRRQAETGTVSHAYIFYGTRGTGKTTCAKILAKAVNCENPNRGDPCNVCPSCTAINSGAVIDVSEIDAASNNSVDNIREIRSEVMYLPSDVRSKVYIVDEVHMLSPGAFNALLITLEEPPPNVIFILATTESHKVPATIFSRTQRFDFRRISPAVIAERLRFIAQQEGFQTQDDALLLIARLAGGSMRDAISLFETCAGAGDGKILYEGASALLGSGNRTALLELFQALAQGDSPNALAIFWNLYAQSYEAATFCSDLLMVIRDLQVYRLCGEKALRDELPEPEIAKIRSLSEITPPPLLSFFYESVNATLNALSRFAANHKITLELLLVKLCEANAQPAPIRSAPPPRTSRISPPTGQSPANPTKNPPNSPPADGKPHLFKRFTSVIDGISSANKSLSLLLAKSRCVIDEEKKTAVVTVANDFAKSLAVLPENIALIEDNLAQIAGLRLKAEIQTDKDSPAPREPDAIDALLE